MKTYELTYIISSGANPETVDAITKEVESLIKQKEGVIVHSAKSGAQSFAYRIGKHASGHFVTVVFQALENTLNEVRASLKHNNILRHALVIKKPVKEVKKRRTRPAVANVGIGETAEKKHQKVEIEDINKKLDEILSE